MGGCAHHPGTVPASGVFWTPPRAEREARQPAPPLQIPAELIERVQQLTLTDVLDVALRNNTATSVAWAQARSASAAYGAARGQYYPTLSLDGAVTALQTAPFGGRTAVKQQVYGPTLNVSWLLLDFGTRGGSIGEARAALLAADWTHNAVIQDVVLAVESAYFQYMATKALLMAQQTTLKEARANLAAADQRHNVGLATIAELLQRGPPCPSATRPRSTEGAIHTTRRALALSMDSRPIAVTRSSYRLPDRRRSVLPTASTV